MVARKPPTAKELLNTTAVPGDEPWGELADRVEKVLELPISAIRSGGWNMAIDRVRRILDGEE